MVMLSYRKKLILLEEIMTDGVRLFKKLLDSEEQLREQLIAGDYQALLKADQKRSDLQQEINTLEERRKALISTDRSMQSFIKTKIGKSSQPGLLEKLATVQETLKKIRVVHEVNRNLLDERLRFSRELQDRLLATKVTYYNQRGQLNKGEAGPSKNIDRNC